MNVQHSPELTIARSEIDYDGDGYSEDEGDCDDEDDERYPGAEIQGCSGDVHGQDVNCTGIDDSQEAEPCENCPVVLDILDNGFSLTNQSQGVAFDLDGNGTPEQLPWTDLRGDDAWLALDRNLNGRIDSGKELFGNFTSQPPSAQQNGFLALAVFDQLAAGGNGDGWIDRLDPIFSRLRLWRDSNQDGVSQREELHTLASVGIRRLSLAYVSSRRVDRWGNAFLYRAEVIDENSELVGRWAFDVFLGYESVQQRRQQ